MHNICLVERIVTRDTDPKTKKFQRIIKMSYKTLQTFEADFVPRVGEIIYLGKNAIYDVVEVIYMEYKIMIEVKPHVSKHNHNVGSYSFEEDWPVIADLTLATE